MFSFFNRQKQEVKDFSALAVDFHSHLVPGIDDGSKNIQESITVIKKLIDLGFKEIITTPHIMQGYYPNTPDNILLGLANLKAALSDVGIVIPIAAAAEYFIDEYFEDLVSQNKQLLTLPQNHLLVECSTFAPSPHLFDIIFQLNIQGYKPILAHPERYLYYAKNFDTFEKIKKLGCSFQLNLLSLTGHYGAGQKKLSIELLKKGLIDFAATDAHGKRHIPLLEKALKNKIVAKYLKDYPFANKKLSLQA